MLAIALVALLIIGSGVVLGLCGRPKEVKKEIPVVIEQPQMIDSVAVEQNKEILNKKSKKKKSGKNSSTKQPKVYRKRSPLDEPVSFI